MVAFDLAVEEIYSVVSRLYEKAISQICLRPEQAFAYVQDETDSLCTSADVGLFAEKTGADYVNLFFDSLLR
ncbi:hypothetical protein [Pseudomonas ogarae]